MISALVVATLLSASADKPKLVVLELDAAGGVEAEVAGALSDTLAAEAAGRGYFQVISSREVQTLLGMERQKQFLGCSDDQSSCLTELSGALGARFILSGTVARLGDAYQLSLQMLDSEKAQTIARSTRLADSIHALQSLMPWAVAEATGTPLPPPPSRVLQYSLIGTGGLLLVAGGIIGQDALSEARALQSELDRGLASGTRLPQTLEQYRAADEDLRGRGVVALGGIALGAALVATGILTMPADVPTPAGARVTLVPTTSGAALVGTFQ